MLHPYPSAHRRTVDVSGLWDFQIDPEDVGEGQGWFEELPEAEPIAVPGSWNDQLPQHRDVLGPAWYATRLERPWGWDDQLVTVRFESVNYSATVWLDGERLGTHDGGHLPFEFDISDQLAPTGGSLVVRVDGRLRDDRVPPIEAPDDRDGFAHDGHPPASMDFFPFCGVQRPVLLCARPRHGIDDVTVTTAELSAESATVRVDVVAGDGEVEVEIAGHGTAATATAVDGTAEVIVDGPAPWSPSSPALYDLVVRLRSDGAAIDEYRQRIGLRTIAVDGDRLLLNGEPVELTGFGRHEDFPVVGRGLVGPVAVHDAQLVRWTGANSFRTSHYPYAREHLELADELGLMVISETPAVGLHFHPDGLDARTQRCRDDLAALIQRDKNHPSVIMWSVANEPHSKRDVAADILGSLIDEAKTLDPSRPTTLVSFLGVTEDALERCDVVSVNRYLGWYTQTGRLEEAEALLAADLDAIHDRFPKPMVVAEFGADALAGHHATPPEMFSEEYQAEMLARYLDVFATKPYVVGAHVWNLIDFRTSQGVKRVGATNLKGVFTRDRRPKLAAHVLRARWGGEGNEDPRWTAGTASSDDGA